MKQFIWILCGVFLSGLLLGVLGACGANPSSVDAVTTGQSYEGGETSVPAEEDDTAENSDTAEGSGLPVLADAAEASSSSAPAVDAALPASEDETRRLAYGKVLEDALFNGVLPDGTKLDWTSAEEAAKNQFAVCDVNGDGEEELLLRWTNACEAGTMDVVFGYDGGEVRQELSEFAGVVFYASGTAEAGWSHNQGWAGRFWPFNLYQYDGSTGTYRETGAVDAWDRSLFEGDEVMDAAFPQDADRDGDGLVYYLLTGEWYKNNRVPSDGSLNGQLWGVDPVDGPDMENWMNVYVDGAEVVRLPLQALTAENISGLGH